MEISIINKGKTVCNLELGFKQILGVENTKIAEVQAEKIMRNKNLRKKVAILIGAGLFLAASTYIPVFAGVSTGPKRADDLGRRFWSYVKIIARWSCILSGGLEVVRNLNSGDTKGIWKVALKYLVAYAVIVGLPWAYDEVDAFFNA